MTSNLHNQITISVHGEHVSVSAYTCQCARTHTCTCVWQRTWV